VIAETSIQNCNATDSSGKIMVYLANIPFNFKGTVTASCDYGAMSVRAACTLWSRAEALPTRTNRYAEKAGNRRCFSSF